MADRRRKSPVPSNLFPERVGARIRTARIMITWGKLAH
jgi:hypothetical protein